MTLSSPPLFDDAVDEQLALSAQDELLLERLWKTHSHQIKALVEQRKSEQDATPSAPSAPPTRERSSSWNDASSSLSSSSTAGEEQVDGNTAEKKASVLDCIAQAQGMCLESEPLSDVFQHLVQGLLDFAESDLGFIGQIQYNEDGSMYLTAQCRGVDHISKEDKQFLFNSPEHRFLCLESIYGMCLTTKKPYITNDPRNDPNRVAHPLPPGHPRLNNFLGIPFFRKGELIGMLGIANKKGGYTQADVALLEPFSVAVSCIIQAYMQMRENERLIETLEEKVRVRTQKLQQANQDLADANRRVVRASQLQLQHFACCSHEIRTPLNCIIGMSSLLEETEMSPMQRESVRMITASGDVLLTVVNDVLDYSKLETGNVEIQICKCSLQETLNAIIHSIQTKAGEKNLTVRTKYDISVPEYIQTDSRRLQQILYNLLGNAIKFTPQKGLIELHVEICREDDKPSLDEFYPAHSQIEKKHGSRNHVIRFRVKDFGQGIDSNDLGKIFQPFRQASVETEKVHGGTGLGLAITSKLVQGLGGRISVSSKVGEGSCFTVDLPLQDTPPSSPAIPMDKLTVFHVESDGDDSDDKVKIAKYLKDCGVEYQTFDTQKDLAIRIPGLVSTQRNRVLVCLIHEDDYDAKEFKHSLRPMVAALLTYGPKINMKSSDGHFRSLGQVLPSVLMNCIASAVKKSREKARTDTHKAITAVATSRARYLDYKILIAEDNKINQKVLLRILNRIGIVDVDVANNGFEAVQKEALTSYDVVLMDYQMPVMDGVEACRKILARQGGHRLPVIVFVTAHASRSFETQCNEAGGSGFLSKPFIIRDLEKTLQDVYEKRSNQ